MTYRTSLTSKILIDWCICCWSSKLSSFKFFKPSKRIGVIELIWFEKKSMNSNFKLYLKICWFSDVNLFYPRSLSTSSWWNTYLNASSSILSILFEYKYKNSICSNFSLMVEQVLLDCLGRFEFEMTIPFNLGNLS